MQVQQDISGEGFRPSREQIDQFVTGQILGVISTLDVHGAPMGATVAFSVAHDGGLLIGTDESSRKATNIARDPRVAVTITDIERRYTLQLQGTARRLAQAAFEADYADDHYRQRPESLPFKDKPNQCHILISPTHIKFTDASVRPWVITEIELS